MRFKRILLVLCFGLLFATSAWGQPANWAVFVPTHAQYTGSGSADFYSYYVNYNFWCSLWNKAGIDHFTWTCCCAGNPGYLDPAISPYNYFDFYQIRGDYYDCNGNLLQSDAAVSSGWGVVKGTGTVFGGGIGGQGSYPLCILSSMTEAVPATACRVFYDMTPVRRSSNYCTSWPLVPPPDHSKILGKPDNGEICPGNKNADITNTFVGNPVNVATGNKYEEVLDLTVSTPGIPLEFRRSYNSQIQLRWSPGLWMDSQL